MLIMKGSAFQNEHARQEADDTEIYIQKIKNNITSTGKAVFPAEQRKALLLYYHTDPDRYICSVTLK